MGAEVIWDGERLCGENQTMTMKTQIAHSPSESAEPSTPDQGKGFVEGRTPNRNGLFIDLSTQLLQHGYRVSFRAPGHSMHPTINDRETVTVEPVPSSHVKTGDIVLYRSEGGVVAHRVIRIERNNDTTFFILRGDALGCPDEPVAAQQVLGKVVSVERNGSSINPYGWKSSIFRSAHNCAFRFKRRFFTKRP